MTRSGLGDTRVIMMARWPEPGRVKTRIASEIGPREAAAVYAEIASHCARRMRAAAISLDERLEVRIDGARAAGVRRWLGYGMSVRIQRGEGLGDKLAHAVTAAFDQDARIAVVVGSDCPELSGDDVRTAVHRIQDGADVALGPATDGGYYLIAISHAAAATAIPALLLNPRIPWGANSVLEDTLRAASAAGLRAELLERELSDIDRPQDLRTWREIVAERDRIRTSPTIAVVIPAIDESEHITETVANALAVGAHEVIVVDGGSSDDTIARARAAGAVTISSPRGRAHQMNAGASAATADYLCFLHADTHLPEDAAAQITRALADPLNAAGAFRYGVGHPHDAAEAINELAGDMRYTIFGLPYGDQAIFLRRQDFEDLGRYTEVATMEDYELAERLREFGRIATAPGRVASSTRGWREHGLLRMTVTNMSVIAGYRLGVTTDTLAKWRRRVAR